MTEDGLGFRFGYNTNGYAHHRLKDALEILREQGWSAVALTLDVHHLDPFTAEASDMKAVRHWFENHAMEVMVETGARFVLDPRRKHRPTLLDADPQERRKRLEFLMRCGDIASAIGARRLSFWAGVPEAHAAQDQCWARLEEGVQSLIGHLKGSGVEACLEPEPGMLVETLNDFERLRATCPELRLALDIGHLYVTGEERPAECITAHAQHLGQLTLEDMRRGQHDHLPFGEGDVDVPATLQALRNIDWNEPIYVELGRHGYDAVTTSRCALEYLRRVERLLT